MPNTLAIFDVSPFIYKGYHMPGFSTERMYTFPIKGVHYLMRYISKELKFNNDVALCFDSRSFRKKILKEYKAHRTPNVEIYAQIDFVYKYLKQCGFVCYKQDQYEADDFIFNVAFANVGRYNTVKIYGVDYDLAHNVDEYGVVFESISNQVCSIDRNNFSAILGKDEEVLFNTVTAYKVLTGDSSDNVKSFISEKGHRGIDIYRMYVDLIKEQCADQNSYYIKSRDLLEYFLGAIDAFTENDRKELNKRMDIFYPAVISKDENGLEYDYTQVSNKNNININAFIKLLKSIKDITSLSALDEHPGQGSDDIRKYLLEQGKKIAEGSYGIDNNLPNRTNRVGIKPLILNGF